MAARVGQFHTRMADRMVAEDPDSVWARDFVPLTASDRYWRVVDLRTPDCVVRLDSREEPESAQEVAAESVREWAGVLTALLRAGAFSWDERTRMWRTDPARVPTGLRSHPVTRSCVVGYDTTW